MKNKIVENYIKETINSLNDIKSVDNIVLVSQYLDWAANKIARINNNEDAINIKDEKTQQLFEKMLVEQSNVAKTLFSQGLIIDLAAVLAEAVDIKRVDLAQHFTPEGVSQLVNNLTLSPSDFKDIIEEEGYVRITDSTIGSGRLVFTVAQAMLNNGYNPCQYLYVEGWEKDARAANMAFIQLSLYAIPACIIHGDTLTKEIIQKRVTLNAPALIHINNTKKEIIKRGWASTVKDAGDYTDKWLTHNTVVLNDKPIEILWYIEETEAANELMYYIQERRFLTDEEMESVIY